METYKRNSFLVLLAPLLLFSFASSAYISWIADYRCKVYFNFTAFKEDENDKLLPFPDCYNTTLKEEGKNYTVFQDCISKCILLKSNVLDRDGKFMQSKFTERYKKYSNGTSEYISNVAKVMNECVEKAGEETRNLKDTGNDESDCTYFGLYEDCTYGQFIRVYRNNTLAMEFCGEKADASTPPAENVIVYDE